MNIKENFRILVIVAVVTLVGNLAGFKINPIEALPGMLILLGIVMLGLLLSKIIPSKLPSIVYISLIGIILTVPRFPPRLRLVHRTSRQSSVLGSMYTHFSLRRYRLR